MAKNKKRSKNPKTPRNALVPFRGANALTARPGTDAGMFRPSRPFNTPEVVLNDGFRQRNQRGSASGAGLPPIVSAYIDPFADEAAAVKYPDEHQGMTQCATGSLTTALTTPGTFTDSNMSGVTAAGDTCLFLLHPDPSCTVVQGVCGTQTGGFYAGGSRVFAWPNGILFAGGAGDNNSFGSGNGNGQDIPIGNIQRLRSSFATGRLVSGGAKITSVQNFATVSGTIHVCPVLINTSAITTNYGSAGAGTDVMNNCWQATLPIDVSEMANMPGYRQYAMSSLETNELALLFGRIGPEAMLFKSVLTTWGMTQTDTADFNNRVGASGNPSDLGHYSLLVFIEGILTNTGTVPAAGTPVVQLNLRNHYECTVNPAFALAYQPQAFGVGADSEDKAAPHQPILMAAANNIASDIPLIRTLDAGGIEELGFVKEVSRLWNTAVRIASGVATAVDVAGAVLAAIAL